MEPHGLLKRNGLRILTWLILATAAAPVAATLLTGAFAPVQVGFDGVGISGSNFLIDGNTYPIPALLQPSAPFTFGLTSSHRFLYAHRETISGDSCTGARVFFYGIPATPGQPLIAIQTAMCIPGGIAWERYYDQPLSSTQVVFAISENVNATPQRIFWVNLNDGSSATTSFAYDIETTSITLARSGNAAFIKHGLQNPFPNGSEWKLVDLCPASLGAQIVNFGPAQLSASPSAEVLDLGAGSYAAQVHDPNLPGGAQNYAITDCLGDPPPPPPDQFVLQVNKIGSGTGRVASPDFRINCGIDCNEAYAENTVVQLTATADPDSTFGAWSTDCMGTNPVTSVTLSANRTCTARFDRISANLIMTAMASPTSVTAGNPLVLTLTTTNLGPAVAFHTTLTLTLPAGTRLAGSPPSGCSLFESSLSCSLGDLALNTPVISTLNLIVEAGARGTLAFRPEAMSLIFDPVLSDQRPQLDVSVATLIDLNLDKIAPAMVAAGDTIAYTLNVSNSGPSMATNVSLVDQLPTGVTPLAGGSGTFQCVLPGVFPGTTVSATLLARVAPDTANGTQLLNNASVAAPETEPNTANNADSASSTVGGALPPAPGAFEKIADLGTAAPGTTTPFSELGTPSQSGAFTMFEGAASGNPETGQVLIRAVSGRLFRAFDLGQPLPGHGGHHINLGTSLSPSVDGSDLVWSGQYYDPTYGFDLSQPVAYTGPCSARFAFDERSPNPNPHALPYLLVSDFRLKQGNIAFSSMGDGGALIQIWNPASGFSTIIDPDSSAPNTAEPLLAVDAVAFDGSNVAFYAGSGYGSGVCGAFADGCLVRGIYARWQGSLRRVADTTTPIPGGTGNFAGFLRYQHSLSVADGYLVFLGYDSQRRYGLYRYDFASSQLNLVADRNTPIPGFAGTFEQFGFVPSSSDPPYDISLQAPATSGRAIAFRGGAAAGGDGLYIWYENVISTVIRVGDPLGGGTVTDLSMQSEGLSAGRLAFLARLGNGNDSIWVTNPAALPVFKNGFDAATP